LFKRWIALSTGKIIIQWISVLEINCIIYWVEIYPMDSATQLLNNWGQVMIRCPRSTGTRLTESTRFARVHVSPEGKGLLGLSAMVSCNTFARQDLDTFYRGGGWDKFDYTSRSALLYPASRSFLSCRFFFVVFAAVFTVVVFFHSR